jgi:hypothetical protein
MYGAVYQDYAEYRQSDLSQPYEPGRCYHDVSGKLIAEKPGRYSNAFIASDTYGQLIGVSATAGMPIAVSGRVLARVEDRARLKPGDILGTSKRIGGALSRLSRLSIILHPEWIIGVVSEIPEYPRWNDVDVKGRVWVNVK